MRELLSEYSAIRDAELIALRNRRAEAFAKIPELEALVREETTLRARKGLLLFNPNEAAQEELERNDKRLTELQDQIQSLLRMHGLPDDELELHHRCPMCQDTGYLEEKRCACLERRLFERNSKRSNLTALEQENFITFDLSVFPEEGGQREGVRRLRELCFDYAENFPHAQWQNLVLFGGIGVGKSFMLNCIAARVLARGYSVRRLTAYQFVQVVMDMIRSGDSSPLRELERVDLLVLDDLGSEPQIKNISAEQLYAVLDERLLARRHTLFATNLGTEQLKERYGERMMSRLLDTRITHCAKLKGKDIRLTRQKAR